ncbi:hypothetical protein [Cedecea davisae]|uniref:hypothetical protein n=1 Tax=Cedecea davisae TaxID=158484 RepID=UPI001D09D441|nr:hypothetical protein [Cedecea davisae]
MASEAVAAATQFPWDSVITGTTGVIGALVGAFLANYFATQRWNEQIKHDQDKEHRKLMREKGEEAFLVLKKWEKELFFFNASRIGYIQKTISEEKLNKTIDEKVDPSTHGRLEVLFLVYFSDLAAELEQLHQQVDKVQRLFHIYSHYRPNLTGAEHMKEESAVYERQCEALKRKLKGVIKNYV